MALFAYKGGWLFSNTNIVIYTCGPCLFINSRVYFKDSLAISLICIGYIQLLLSLGDGAVSQQSYPQLTTGK